MVYAAVLGGGAGTRMQNSGILRHILQNRANEAPRQFMSKPTDEKPRQFMSIPTDELPKQFLPLGDKCILVHTAEQFLDNPQIDKIYVSVPEGWLGHAERLFGDSPAFGARSGNMGKLAVVQGRGDRNSTLMAAVGAIEEAHGISQGDIIVTHDAVRPFLTQRIIDENIAECKKCGAADTVYAMIDTPVISEDGETVADVPDRAKYYLSQTPQTFNISLLKEVYASLTAAEKSVMTDACKMFVLKGKTVRIVAGESYNIKITTPFDYAAALAFMSARGA